MMKRLQRLRSYRVPKLQRPSGFFLKKNPPRTQTGNGYHNWGTALAQAWGFSSILLLPDYIDLTSQAGDARMRVPSPLTKIALAHLTDMLIVAVVFALLTALLRRFKSWPAIRWMLVALLPPMLFVRNLNVMPFDIPSAAVIA